MLPSLYTKFMSISIDLSKGVGQSRLSLVNQSSAAMKKDGRLSGELNTWHPLSWPAGMQLVRDDVIPAVKCTLSEKYKVEQLAPAVVAKKFWFSHEKLTPFNFLLARETSLD